MAALLRTRINSCKQLVRMSTFHILRRNLASRRVPLSAVLPARLQFPKRIDHFSLLRHCSTSAKAAEDCQQFLNVDVAGRTYEFNVMWLRENCRCSECYNVSTWQKNVLFHKLHDVAVVPGSVSATKDRLLLTWSDGHTSEYSLQWLAQKLICNHDQKGDEKLLWDARTLIDSPVKGVRFGDFLNDDYFLKAVLSNLLVYGFATIVDVPVDHHGTESTAKRICPVQQTLFGRMWTFTSDLSRADTAYTNIALGAHTDTSYFGEPAGLQMFHCLYHDGDAGETLLVDGFHAADVLQRHDPHSYQILSSQPICHEYLEPGYHMESVDTILKACAFGSNLNRIRYNHYDRSPITTMEPQQMENFYSALANLSVIIEDPRNEYWIKLNPGTILFVDNWRVLHGRAAFTGTREMCGCYLPRDDWMGKARVLGLA